MFTWKDYNRWYMMYKYYNIYHNKVNNTFKANYSSLFNDVEIICEDNELYYLLHKLSTTNIKKYNSIVYYYKNNCIMEPLINFIKIDKHEEKNKYIPIYDDYEEYGNNADNFYEPYELDDGMYETYSISPSDLNKNIYSTSPVFDHLGYQKVDSGNEADVEDYDAYYSSEELDENYFDELSIY